MRIVPCKMWHLRALELESAEAEVILRHAAADDEEDFSEHSRAVIVGDKVVACLGISPIWEGVASGWAVVGRQARESSKMGFLVCWAAKKCIREAHEAGFKRLQADVQVDVENHLISMGWAQWLGFETEGLMRHYGPGAKGDYLRYARFN